MSRARDIYPAEHLAMGRAPDTQPIDRDTYIRLQRRASQPRHATAAERLGRATLAGMVTLPLSAAVSLAGALYAGWHGAAIGAALGGLVAALRAVVASADSRPL